MKQAIAMILVFGILFLLICLMFFLQSLLNKRNHKETINSYEANISTSRSTAEIIKTKAEKLLNTDSLKDTLGKNINEILHQFEERAKTFEKIAGIREKYDFVYYSDGRKLKSDFDKIAKLNGLLNEQNILKLKIEINNLKMSLNRTSIINKNKSNNTRKNDKYYQNYDYFNQNLSDTHLLMIMVDDSYDNEKLELRENHNHNSTVDKDEYSSTYTHSHLHSSCDDNNYRHSIRDDSNHHSFNDDSHRHSGGYSHHNDNSNGDYGGYSSDSSSSSGGWD